MSTNPPGFDEDRELLNEGIEALGGEPDFVIDAGADGIKVCTCKMPAHVLGDWQLPCKHAVIPEEITDQENIKFSPGNLAVTQGVYSWLRQFADYSAAVNMIPHVVKMLVDGDQERAEEIIEGAKERFIKTIALRLLNRHVHGDWGELDPEDKEANDRAITDGTRILSAYKEGHGKWERKLWVITEAGRHVTTVLFPDEY